MSLKLVPPRKLDSLEAKVNAGVQALFDINLDEVLHPKGGKAANGDRNDPVVAHGTAELKLRQLIKEFGFNRLPVTFGELHGLLGYCEMLHVVAGLGTIDPKAKNYETATRAGQESRIEVYGRSEPHHVAALRLYCAGDREALQRLHGEEMTLARLGDNYRQFGAD